MSRNTKSVPAFILIIAIFAGSMLQYVSPRYQLIFIGISIIVLFIEIIKLKRIGKENEKIVIFVSVIILLILIGVVVIGKNYSNMNENIQWILLLIAFVEFILTVSIFGYRIVIKSGDNRRVRQFMIGVIGIVVIILLLGIIILFP